MNHLFEDFTPVSYTHLVEQARVQIAARVAIGADIRDEHRVKLQPLGQRGGHHHHPAGIVGILRGEPLHRLPQRLLQAPVQRAALVLIPGDDGDGAVPRCV